MIMYVYLKIKDEFISKYSGHDENIGHLPSSMTKYCSFLGMVVVQKTFQFPFDIMNVRVQLHPY